MFQFRRAGLLAGGLVIAAEIVTAQSLPPDGTPQLRHLATKSAAALRQQPLDARELLRAELALRPADDLRALRPETDELSQQHERFQQYFNGVKVEHGVYTVHRATGVLSGEFKLVPTTLSTKPVLSAAAALLRGLAAVGARRYLWEDAAAEAGLRRETNNPVATYRPQGELVIVRDARQGAELGPLVLAWKFNVYAQQPVSRAWIYVDARTGEVVLKDAIIKHTAATATFATAYSGSRSIADGTTTGGYYLRELTRGNGIETYNCKKGNSYTAAVDFVDADNNWTAAEYNNANFDNVAGDAQMGAQCTYDYWKAVHGRNSYDNAGAKIKSYVHFDDTPGDGVGYENANWNGSVMTYGDGATRFRPLTSLDVCGHEIGHAVCQSTANLTYSNESGAMNEGLSDIWGASIEAYSVANLGVTSSGVKAKSTYLIGEEIDKVQVALRSMSDPRSLSQPALYKGQYWYTGTSDNGGVHTNSGVLNYWYYLISNGASGTNELGNAFSVTGLGLTAAAKITFRMESVYMTAGSTYANARTYSIQAATDLYGATSTQVQSVTNAWYAVGVGAAYGSTPPPPTVTYCTSKGTSQAYEYVDLVNIGSINRTSGSDAGYYNGTALSTSVGAGTSQTIYFSAGFTGAAYTEYWKIYIDYNQNGVFTDAGELVVSGSSSSSGTLYSTFTVPTTAKSGSTRMRVVMSDNSATTSCNSYSYGETEDYTLSITGGTLAPPTLTAQYGLTGGSALGNEQARVLEVYPNPATDLLRISVPGEATSVQITDVRGARMSNISLVGSQVNISSLAKGLYTITVSNGEKVFHQRFVKE
ncbi:MAG: M4 family metallopeptidase [Hymenobacter sp.]